MLERGFRLALMLTLVGCTSTNGGDGGDADGGVDDAGAVDDMDAVDDTGTDPPHIDDDIACCVLLHLCEQTRAPEEACPRGLLNLAIYGEDPAACAAEAARSNEAGDGRVARAVAYCDAPAAADFGQIVDDCARCSTGLCLDRAEGQLCSQACDLETGCPATSGCIDGRCTPLPAPRDGGDAQIGEPCASGADCASLLCVGGPNGATFCSRECSPDAPCPAGFECRDGSRFCTPAPDDG